MDTKPNHNNLYDFIFIIKTIAILLIINSHMKPIYEGSLDKLAFGGAFGCALFFFCSGFTINIKENENFWKFIIKRLIRIYPALWIFLIVTQSYTVWSDFFWYNRYWFLQAIIVFYILFYFVKKYLIHYLKPIIIILAILYTVTYINIPHHDWIIDLPKEPHRITWIYYFIIMLIGLYLRNTTYDFNLNINNISKCIIFIICFISTYGLKFICQQKIVAMNWQVIFPLNLIISCIILYFTCNNIKIKSSKILILTKFIASITLELYIVQFSCIYFSASYTYPFRFFLSLIIIFTTAVLLKKTTNIFIKGINHFIK